jgi:hypothetical protein
MGLTSLTKPNLELTIIAKRLSKAKHASLFVPTFSDKRLTINKLNGTSLCNKLIEGSSEKVNRTNVLKQK